MGDVVFAPFYEVLRRRGVRFEFFHRLEQRAARRPGRGDGDAPHVEALEFDVQAEMRGGGEYRAARRRRAACPAGRREPDWRAARRRRAPARARASDFESLWDRRAVRAQDAARRRRLRLRRARRRPRRRPARLPRASSRAIRAGARWSTTCKTVATQAFQIWLTRRHGRRSAGRDAADQSSRASSSPSTPGPTCAICSPRERWPQPPRGARLLLQRPARSRRRRRPSATPTTRRAQREAGARATRFAFSTATSATSGRDAARAAGEFRWELLADAAAAGAGGPSARARSTRSSGPPTSIRPTATSLSLPGSSALPHLAARRHLRQPDRSPATGPTAASTPAASRRR